MATKTKSKRTFDLQVESLELNDFEKGEIKSCLHCSKDVISELGELLTKERHWIRKIKSLPLASNLRAELMPLYEAAHALEKILMPGQLSTNAQQKLLSMYFRFIPSEVISDKREVPSIFYRLDQSVCNLARATRLAIEEINMEIEKKPKETGGTGKKRMAAYTKDSKNKFLEFFDKHASDHAKKRKKDRDCFLKFCFQKISS